jgi:methionyl-tRNA formyltransferase
MRVVFFGTPAFAVPSLDALAASPHEVVAVVTQPDRARGRGQRVSAAPVKARALELGLPVLQPERLRDDQFLAAFDTFGADLAVVAAYGRILPQALLDRPRHGMINVHASLLPRWRGAAPVHRAILAGDRETGITIMRVVLALDAGPMLAREGVDIDPNETSAALESRLATLGARMLVPVVDTLARGPLPGLEQDAALVTYAQRIERADGHVVWTRPAQAIHDQIRGLYPCPHASVLIHGRRTLLLESRVENVAPVRAAPGTVMEAGNEGIVVAAEPGAIRILRLQPEGRAGMTARDFLNGRPMRAGDHIEPVAQET